MDGLRLSYRRNRGYTEEAVVARRKNNKDLRYQFLRGTQYEIPGHEREDDMLLYMRHGIISHHTFAKVPTPLCISKMLLAAIGRQHVVLQTLNQRLCNVSCYRHYS